MDAHSIVASRWAVRCAPATGRCRNSRALAMVSGVSYRHHLAAARAAFRTEIDHPVRRLDDVEVVLDDQDRSARLDQPAECRQQLADVIEVQAGGGLVEDVEHARVALVLLALRACQCRAAWAEGAPPASCAAPRRRKAWLPTVPAADIPGQLLPARAASPRSSARRKRSAAPPSP